MINDQTFRPSHISTNEDRRDTHNNTFKKINKRMHLQIRISIVDFGTVVLQVPREHDMFLNQLFLDLSIWNMEYGQSRVPTPDNTIFCVRPSLVATILTRENITNDKRLTPNRLLFYTINIIPLILQGNGSTTEKSTSQMAVISHVAVTVLTLIPNTGKSLDTDGCHTESGVSIIRANGS